MNIVHQLDPELVAIFVKRKIDYYRRIRTLEIERTIKALAQFAKTPKLYNRKPCSVRTVQRRYKSYIDYELSYYAKVRVIELPKSKRSKRFILVYGDEDNATVTQGTGPFLKLEQATNWFYSQGR